jgi:hypothetical protein
VHRPRVGHRALLLAGLGDQGHLLRQAYRITVKPPLPLAIGLTAGGSTLPPGTAEVMHAQNFFLSSGAAPYTWSVAAGQLPPGLACRPPVLPPTATTSLRAHRPPRARLSSP